MKLFFSYPLTFWKIHPSINQAKISKIILVKIRYQEMEIFLFWRFISLEYLYKDSFLRFVDNFKFANVVKFKINQSLHPHFEHFNKKHCLHKTIQMSVNWLNIKNSWKSSSCIYYASILKTFNSNIKFSINCIQIHVKWQRVSWQ